MIKRLLRYLGLSTLISKPICWSQRVDFWPAEYPHRIVTLADVAALKHLMYVSGVLNVHAIDLLVEQEGFWMDLGKFFQAKIEAKALEEVNTGTLLFGKGVRVRRVPLIDWSMISLGEK